MASSGANHAGIKGNQSVLKLIATILAVLAIFGAMGVAWGTAQTQIGDLQRRLLTAELDSLKVKDANHEILVRLERIETSLEYISERVSKANPVPKSPSAPPSS